MNNSETEQLKHELKSAGFTSKRAFISWVWLFTTLFVLAGCKVLTEAAKAEASRPVIIQGCNDAPPGGV